MATRKRPGASRGARARQLRALLALAPETPWVERREEMLLALNASKPLEPTKDAPRRRRGTTRKRGTTKATTKAAKQGARKGAKRGTPKRASTRERR